MGGDFCFISNLFLFFFSNMDLNIDSDRCGIHIDKQIFNFTKSGTTTAIIITKTTAAAT